MIETFERAAVFADVHGRSDQLRVLLDEIERRYGKIPVFNTGDLNDRGLDTKGAVDLCIERGVRGICGNHDDWVRTLLVNKVFDEWVLGGNMGGSNTMLSYGVERSFSTRATAEDFIRKMPESHKQWFASLPAYRHVVVAGQNVWLIHAGLTWNWDIQHGDFLKMSNDDMMEKIAADDHMRSEILWTRPAFGLKNEAGHIIQKDNMFVFDDGFQIVGHSIVTYPIVREHFIALDTGCGAFGPKILSGIILPEREIIQVDSNCNILPPVK